MQCIGNAAVTRASLSRRALALSALASVLPRPAGATADEPAADPEAWARTVAAHIRLRADHDGGRAFYLLSGDIWARRSGAVAERILGVETCSFNRLTRLPDGKLEHRSAELGGFKDLSTGAYLDTWHNPYTGESCDVPLIGNEGRAARVVLTPSGAPEGLSSRVRGSFLLGAPVARSGTVWLTEDTAVLIARPVPTAPGAPPQERMVSTSGLTTFSAREADLRGTRGFVPVTLSFVEVAEWWPWMKMGSVEGFMTWRLYGAKLRSPRELPPAFAAFLERRKPGWLAAPGV